MRRFSTLLLLLLAAPLGAEPLPRFVDARGAWILMSRQAALLDARTPTAYGKGHLSGARRVDWESFSDPSGPLAKGRLHPDEGVLGRLAGAAGVTNGRPVLVYGDPLAGWGEEGRLAWMLELLGHPDVHVLDGGVAAWTAAGGTLTREVPAAATGTFEVRPIPATSATAEDVKRAIGAPGTLLLDTRTDEEYRGATWYGVPRGGHVPGARSFPWKQLLDGSGKLLPAARIRELAGAGGQAPTTIIAYCTGGVRSGFVYWALAHAGVTGVRNYPGSWWEWSGRSDLPVER